MKLKAVYETSIFLLFRNYSDHYFFTHRTDERFVSSVSPKMSFQFLAGEESFGTRVAFERPLAAVRPQVNFQVRELPENLLTKKSIKSIEKDRK